MRHCLQLFGGERPWDAAEWEATDDRVRGGSSVSHLTPIPPDARLARFHGHLDTSTLGGAGFASQNTKSTRHWDLSGYDGLILTLGPSRASDSTGPVDLPAVQNDQQTGSSSLKTQRFVINLKDTIPGRREDGRKRSGVSWEASFESSTSSSESSGETSIWLPWSSFRATYRGRPKDDAEPLDLTDVKRVGLMMRSFFDQQSGDFDLILRGIAASKKPTDSLATSTADDSQEQQLGETRGDGGDHPAGAKSQPRRVEDDEEDYEDLQKPIGQDQSGGAAGYGRDARNKKPSWWRGVFCGLL